MNRLLKKIAAASLLSGVPLVIIIYDNYIHHGRGWHTMLIQYHSFFWLTRLLVTPLLVLVTLKLWQKADNPFKLFFFPSITFVFYNFLCWSISLITCRLLANGFDGRNRNLFNTIRYESTFLNLLIYVATVLIVFTWLYFERHAASEKKTLVLKESLNEAKQELIKIRSTSKEIPANGKSGKIAVKIGYKTFLIPVVEITCIQSNGPYVNIITENGSYILKKTLLELGKILPVSFLRVHRSSIVNMEFVKELRSLLNGDACLILKNGKEIRSSRTYREIVLNVLSNR